MYSMKPTQGGVEDAFLQCNGAAAVPCPQDGHGGCDQSSVNVKCVVRRQVEMLG